MSAIATFFKESDTSLGIFYPVHYIVATMKSSEAAVEAESALRRQGSPEDEVLALSSEEAQSYFRDHRESQGVVGTTMMNVSRVLGDDAAYTDAHMLNAGEGHGFLLVRCETDERAKAVKETICPLGATNIHWYRSGGIQSLI